MTDMEEVTLKVVIDMVVVVVVVVEVKKEEGGIFRVGCGRGSIKVVKGGGGKGTIEKEEDVVIEEVLNWICFCFF